MEMADKKRRKNNQVENDERGRERQTERETQREILIDVCICYTIIILFTEYCHNKFLLAFTQVNMCFICSKKYPYFINYGKDQMT